MGRLLTVALLRETPHVEVTVVGDSERVADMLLGAHRCPLPNRTIAGGDPEDPAVAALPAMEGRLASAGSAFVCVGSTCYEPADSHGQLDAALRRAQSVILEP